MTLGSLFDGIGGFPLAGVMCGITPVWASEIEPFPVKVTAARFPEMKQLGSVTDINGARLQGFPDWWCEGLGGSDSAIYKAYGNGLALPCAYDVLRRIAKEYDQTTL